MQTNKINNWFDYFTRAVKPISMFGTWKPENNFDLKVISDRYDYNKLIDLPT